MRLWFRVVSVGALTVLSVACGNRDRASSITGIDPITSVVPIVVTLTGWAANARDSKLTWVEPLDANPNWSVRIYRDEVLVGIAPKYEFSETGLKPNTTYRYRVAPTRVDGVEMMSSNTIFLTMPSAVAERIDITPLSTSAVVGTPIQLSAVISDSATGTPVTNQSVTWSSDNGTIAIVSSTGLFTPYATGTVVVNAANANATGIKTFTIVAPATARATSVTVSPATSTVDAGKSLQLSAIARDAAGVQLTRELTWSSSNANVASVSPTGIVTALATGLVVIRAKADDATGSAEIIVQANTTVGSNIASLVIDPHITALANGGTANLVATAKDGAGVLLTGLAITWRSENPGIASVSSSGVVTANDVGSTVVFATSGGVTGTAIVTVSAGSNGVPLAVNSLIITPMSATVAVGGSAQYTAVLRDADNNQLSGRTIVWTSSNPTVGTITSDGRVVGLAGGVSTIGAMSEGKTSTAELIVQVNAPPIAAVATISVNPPAPTMSVGEYMALAAITKEENGSVVTGRVVTWASSNPSVALVSPAGYITALGAGDATITATSEGRIGTAAVAVTLSSAPAAVNAVLVMAPATNLAIGGTMHLTAVTKDVAGNTLSGRFVTWSSNSNGIAMVSSSGLLTAIATGVTTITATSEGKSATAIVTVNAPSVALVVIAPSVLPLLAGQTGQLVAVTRNSDGIQLNGRSIVWSSNNTSIVSVTESGVVTAVTQGAAIVTATSEGVSGTASVLVGVGTKAVATVTVQPNSITLVAGLSVQLAATTADAGGTIVTGRVVTWSSSNTSVATVSATGLVTGVAGGMATIRATSEGVSATDVATVSPKPVAVAKDSNGA